MPDGNPDPQPVSFGRAPRDTTWTCLSRRPAPIGEGSRCSTIRRGTICTAGRCRPSCRLPDSCTATPAPIAAGALISVRRRPDRVLIPDSGAAVSHRGQVIYATTRMTRRWALPTADSTKLGKRARCRGFVPLPGGYPAVVVKGFPRPIGRGERGSVGGPSCVRPCVSAHVLPRAPQGPPEGRGRAEGTVLSDTGEICALR